MERVIIAASSGLFGSLCTIFISLIKRSGARKANKAMTAEIQYLKTRLDEFIKNPLTLKNGIYYDTNGNPYCPACYGSPYDRIPLNIVNKQGSWTLYHCPKCREDYSKGEFPKGNHKPYSVLDNF
jgi:hypothetical protein